MDNNNSMKTHYENLLSLFDSSWTYISAPKRRKLNEQKPHVVEMPITNDIKLFLHYLSMEIAKIIREFIHDEIPLDFTKLNKLVLAYLIVFNRRREGEVSKLKLKTYIEQPKYDDFETDICQETLSATEKILTEHFKYMSTVGKRGRRVPIVYPGLIVKALDILVQNREKGGIQPNNEYLFANSTENYIRGGDVLREFVEQCHSKHPLKKPYLIRSTKLRKHVSTIAQILILSGEQLIHLSNHLGHSEAVHRQFYRQQESFIEKTQIAKMLGLINSGTVAKYKGQSLDDVTLDDIIEHATNEVINEDNDEVDDDDDDDDHHHHDDDDDHHHDDHHDDHHDSHDDHHDDHHDSHLNDTRENKTVCNNSKKTVPSMVAAFSKPVEQIHVPSTSTSKKTRNVWSKHIKDCIKKELGDCIGHENIKNLTPARADEFLKKK